MEAMGDCWGRDGKGHPVTYNRYGNVDVKDIFSVPGEPHSAVTETWLQCFGY